MNSTEGAGSTFHLWLPQADFTEAERMAAQNAERRRSVLLVGHPGLAADSITEFLRTNNFYVVATQTPARALELLATEERDLHGVMVLADPGDDAMLGLVAELRERGLARRIVLQIIGGNADQLDQRAPGEGRPGAGQHRRGRAPSCRNSTSSLRPSPAHEPAHPSFIPRIEAHPGR